MSESLVDFIETHRQIRAEVHRHRRHRFIWQFWTWIIALDVAAIVSLSAYFLVRDWWRFLSVLAGAYAAVNLARRIVAEVERTEPVAEPPQP